MKSWEVSADIRSDPGLAAGIDRVKPVIEDVARWGAPLVDARWTISGDPGDRRTVVLNLSDWTSPDGVEARFTPDELEPDHGFRRRIRRLWGDLLQVRNHRQLAQLQAEE